MQVRLRLVFQHLRAFEWFCMRNIIYFSRIYCSYKQKQYGSSIPRINAIWSIYLLWNFIYDKRVLATAVVMCILAVALVSNIDSASPLQEAKESKNTSCIISARINTSSMEHGSFFSVRSVKSSIGS